VLKVVAAVLSQQGVVQSLLLQAPPAQAGLVRLLLHMFAPAVLPEQSAAASDRPDGVQGAADAAGHAAAQGAGVRAASPVKGATSSTAAKPAAGAGAKKPGAAAAGAHEQAAAGAGATTPRKGAAASNSGAKEQKVNHGCNLFGPMDVRLALDEHHYCGYVLLSPILNAIDFRQNEPSVLQPWIQPMIVVCCTTCSGVAWWYSLQTRLFLTVVAFGTQPS
jgi:hypothetical protein